jgi:transcriptional regulator with XRE-family HTH domain
LYTLATKAQLKEAFKALRLAYGLTQIEFAILLKVSKPTIQKLEAGEYPPSNKINARLVELFQTDRFRNELRPRVEGGDLNSIKVAFGRLLERVDVEAATSLSPEPLVSSLSDADATAYEDLKRQYNELIAIIRSQQGVIQTLSETNKNLIKSNSGLIARAKRK